MATDRPGCHRDSVVGSVLMPGLMPSNNRWSGP